MFKFSLVILLISLGTFSVLSQNSNFSANINSQCPGNLFTLTADDNSMSTYLWTITENGGGSYNYNVNPVAFVLDNAATYDVTLTVISSGGVSSSTTQEDFPRGFCKSYCGLCSFSLSVLCPINDRFYECFACWFWNHYKLRGFYRWNTLQHGRLSTYVL